jgi:hypothetical protein
MLLEAELYTPAQAAVGVELRQDNHLPLHSYVDFTAKPP